jgi:Mn2+/Fe2+ NRAMP family transporter
MRSSNFWKTLGPGILFASTCIGVSHLVQSTRAGANFGFALVWAVLLSNLFKYPFFEYASRYANATQTSIIDGYLKLGKGVLILYAVITLLTMFFVTSAVGVVTAGFMDNLLGLQEVYSNLGFSSSSWITPALVFGICAGILLAGKYGLLDSLIKVIGAVLLLSTLLAFIMVLFKGPQGEVDFSFLSNDEESSLVVFPFLIALMGWMPTALDLSSWNSLWTIERIKQTGYVPKLRETQVDFAFGYIVSAFLALCFITLGAYLMFGTGEQLSDRPDAFAHQVVTMYTNAMGPMSYWLIAVSAFSIMFGTCIAVLDGYARSAERILHLLFSKEKGSEISHKKAYNGTLIALIGCSFGLMYFTVYAPNSHPKAFKNLIDFTTTFSFVVAPIIAILNFRLVQKKFVGEDAKPGTIMQILSYLGISFLLTFSIIKLLY